MVHRTTPINTAFKPFLAMPTRVRDVLRRTTQAVPTNDKGTSMCISYHVKGVCNANCSRVQDHCPHSAAEDQKLLAWLTDNYKVE